MFRWDIRRCLDDFGDECWRMFGGFFEDVLYIIYVFDDSWIIFTGCLEGCVWSFVRSLLIIFVSIPYSTGYRILTNTSGNK